MTPATRTSSPFLSMLAEVKSALYAVSLPKENEPMIAVSVPVTITLTSTKMPSLIAATVVLVLREAAQLGLPPAAVSPSVPLAKSTGPGSGTFG